jgi:hypothetical protein
MNTYTVGWLINKFNTENMYKKLILTILSMVSVGFVFAGEYKILPSISDAGSSKPEIGLIGNKKFKVKSIYIGQDYQDFMRVGLAQNLAIRNCGESNRCDFDGTIFGVYTKFSISFSESKVDSIIMRLIGSQQIIQPAFSEDQVKDYLNEEFGKGSEATEEIELRLWIEKFFLITFSYECAKKNLNSEPMARSCIDFAMRNLNLGIQSSVMMNGTTRQQITDYEWLAAGDRISYLKVRGKFHPKFAKILHSIGHVMQGNHDQIYISRDRGASKSIAGVIKLAINQVLSESEVESMHEQLEKETGIIIRPQKIKKEDF